MGDDFSNHQIFAGQHPPDEFRNRLVAHLKTCLHDDGFVETFNPEAATRTFAIGHAKKWICIYDSFGSGDTANPKEFVNLSKLLSQLAPVVDIHMDDSCAVHFRLYENGDEIDRYGNMRGVASHWESAAERLSFLGKTPLWLPFLDDQNDEVLLRETWDNHNATAILKRTAQLIGWNETFCFGGFTVDYDGIPVFYREHFGEEFPTTYGEFLQVFPQLDFFDELYFSTSSTR